jgi:hypothetical protein
MPTTDDFATRFRWIELADTWAGLFPLWAGSMPSVPVVEIGAFTGLTLDSPLIGRLDENPLDGDITFTPIPQGLVSASATRGRDKDIGRTSAGSLQVNLRNEDRFFDPLVGPWGERTKPRLPIRLNISGVPTLTGFVDDWNFDYDPSGESVASIDATDGFSRFARQINAGGSAPVESTGDRLNRVLDQGRVNFLGPRDIDNGNSTLAEGLLEGSALEYMLDVVEASELGLVFMAKDGAFSFRERLLSTVDDVPVFASNGAGIPFNNIQIEYGSEDLVNQAIVTGPEGTAIAEDLTSQVTYGITALQIDTQLSTLAAQQGIADFVITRFSEPEYRFRSITVNMRGITPTDRAIVYGLEIGDQVDVVFVPNNIPPAISIRNRIIGVSHNVDLDNHFVTFNFEALPFVFFVLDDPVFGKLDEADVVLGF